MYGLLRVAALATLVTLLPATALADVPDQGVEEPEAAPDRADELPAEANLMTLFGSASEDQRTRMLRFIRNRYPDLSAELLALLQSNHPGIFIDLEGEINDLISARYPRLSMDVQRLLQKLITERHPQVRQEIAELIAAGYPDLIEAMHQVGEGDADTRTARLIREKHRQLLDDVLNLLRKRHPSLLVEVRREVLVKNPALLADVARIIAKRYPDLSLRVTLKLAQKYPELIPGILQILAPVAEDQGTVE